MLEYVFSYYFSILCSSFYYHKYPKIFEKGEVNIFLPIVLIYSADFVNAVDDFVCIVSALYLM